MGKLFGGGGGGGTQTQTVQPMPNGSGDMPGIEGDLFREMGRHFLNQAQALPNNAMYRYLPINPNMQQGAAPQFDQQQFQQMQQQYRPQQQQMPMADWRGTGQTTSLDKNSAGPEVGWANPFQGRFR